MRGGSMTVFFGADVTKERFDCAAIAHERERSVRKKSFLTTLDAIERAAAWVTKVSKDALWEAHALREPTGAYHALAARFLAITGLTVFAR
jgi:hypothetical protein